MRSRIRAFAPLLVAVLALPAEAASAPAPAFGGSPGGNPGGNPGDSRATPRVSVYALRMDPGAPVKRGVWNSGYGGGFDVTWPIPRSQGLLAVVGGAEASSLLSGVRTVVDSASGDRTEHHMDQLYGRVFVGGELGPHGDGTLEPYANLALAMIAYGYFDDALLTLGGDHGGASQELVISQHELGFGWSAGAGVNLNFRRFGMTGGVRYLRQFGAPRQLGNGAVWVEPAYMQYRLGVTMPFPTEAGAGL